MKTKLITLLTLIALVAVVVACGGAGSSATQPAAPAQKPAEAPKQEAPKAAAPTEAPKAAAPTQAPAAQKPAEAPKATEAPKAAAPKVTVNNPPKTADEVDAIELTGKNVEVIYWHNRPQKDQDLLQQMLDEFNKTNPYGIKAKAEIGGASYNDVYNKVNAAIQAGKPPEMTVAYQNQAAFYRAQGAVIDLTPFINSKKYGLTEDDKKDLIQTFIDSDANPQFKGERLGFPTQRSMEVMYVNTDMLKQLGYNDIPKDWKTWEEAACKASDPSKNKYGWAFRHDASNFASMVFAYGGRILAEDGSAYAFNSQAGQDVVAMLQRLFKNKCAVEIPTSERFGEQNRFGNGEILFVFSSSSGLPFYQDTVAKGAKFNWDIAMLPNNGKPAVNLYGASVSVYKTTPEKNLASWLVLKYLSGKEQTTKWAVATGYLPVRQSAKADVAAQYKANPQWGKAADSYLKLFDWTGFTMVESPVAGYDPVRALIDKDVLSVTITDQTKSPKEILDAAVKKANDILKENAPK